MGPKGKLLGAPVHDLLGGRVRERVRVYRNLWGRNPEEFADSAKEAKSNSMTAVKVSPAGPTPDVISRAQLDEMEAVVSAVKNAVGPAVDLAIDLHGRLTPAASRRAIHALSKYDPFFIEEPCLPDGSASHLADLQACELHNLSPLLRVSVCVLLMPLLSTSYLLPWWTSFNRM